MKSLIIAVAALAGAAVAAPALAQTADTAGPSLTSPQAYVNLGYTYLNPYGRDLGELTGRLGLRMGKYWGVEGEFGGGVTSNTFTLPNGSHGKLSEGTESAGYLVGFYPAWGDKLDLIARVGYGDTPLQLRGDASDANGAGVIPNHFIAVASWNYGAGFQYLVNAKDGVRFDYTRRDFQFKGADNPRDDNTYSLSLVHKF